MSKYIIIDDVFILDELVFKKGDEIDIIDDNIQIISNTLGNISIKPSSLKDKIKRKEDINIDFIELNDENEIGDFRLQIDLKVTRKKAREIENYLRETLEKLI